MGQERMKEAQDHIKKKILENINLTKTTDEMLEEQIREEMEAYFAGTYVSIGEKAFLCDQVFSSIRGFGLLDTIISDDSVTEVMINGPDEIFIEKSGKLMKLNEHFESEERLQDIIQRIVALAGREVNQASPIVDTRLPDGSRVNVVLPPISLKGPIVTIRKFSREPMTVEKLIRYGSITPQIAEVLKTLVKAKYNIFINLVSLETRNANTTGVGAITIRDLIKSALRMRPDRIVVGEVRGAEALDMLQAMNTGHDGSLSTGHANSSRDMLSRLETMVLTGEEGLPLAAVRQQIASAVDIIVHLSRLRDRSRKTMEITEVVKYENGEIQLNPLYRFEEDESSTIDKVSGMLKRTDNAMVNDFKLKLMGYRGKI